MSLSSSISNLIQTLSEEARRLEFTANSLASKIDVLKFPYVPIDVQLTPRMSLDLTKYFNAVDKRFRIIDIASGKILQLRIDASGRKESVLAAQQSNRIT